jgi:hypothetical protein
MALQTQEVVAKAVAGPRAPRRRPLCAPIASLASFGTCGGATTTRKVLAVRGWRKGTCAASVAASAGLVLAGATHGAGQGLRWV